MTMQPPAYQRLSTVLMVIVCGSLLGFVLFKNDHFDADAPAQDWQKQPARERVRRNDYLDARKLSESFEAVAYQLRASVVHIDSVLRAPPPVEPVSGGGDLALHHSVAGGDLEGIGSGVILTSDGYVLTNSHLVRGAQSVRVRLVDGTSYKAEIVGADPHTEVSVLKIDASGLVPAELGDSDGTAVGQWVLAVGSPYGLDQTVTAGIISAKGRANLGIAGQEDFLQTDAAINPGNSGGPLVNLDGKVVGITTAIASKSGGSTGIGFAIPINLARTVSETIIREGGIARGWLGIAVQELTSEMARSFGHEGTEGVLVSDVEPGGPAEKAGIQPGDIVLKFDGEKTADSRRFREQVAAVAPRTKAELELFRDGSLKSVAVELADRPDDEQAAVPAETKNPDASGGSSASDLGIDVRDLTAELAHRLGFEDIRGAVVAAIVPHRLAGKAGLRPGDVIVSIGNEPVRNADVFRQIMQRSDLKHGVRLQVRSLGGIRRFILLRATDSPSE